MYTDDNVSISSGSLSPDLGEMWRYGCPKSLDWDSDTVGRSDEEDANEYLMGNMRHVLEGPLWEWVRAFLVPDDVLCMPMTAGEWNVAGLCGLYAELCFFLMKKDSKYEPVPSVHEIR